MNKQSGNISADEKAAKQAIDILSDAAKKIWNRVITFVSGIFTGQIKKEKRCTKCGSVKLLTDFYQHKGHRNRSRICKVCHVGKNKLSGQIFLEKNPQYNSELNKKHRERKTELQREYDKKNRTK